MSKDIFLFFIPWRKLAYRPKVWKTKVGCEAIFLRSEVFSAPAASGKDGRREADICLRRSQY